MIVVLVILGFLIGDDIAKAAHFVFHNDPRGLNHYLRSIDLWSAIFVLGGLQIIQIVFAVLPSEFVQMASFIVFGPFIGLLVMYIAVITGSIIVYLIVHFFKKYIFVNENSVQRDLGNAQRSMQNRSLFLVVLGLYFAPAIPYGIISYYAARKRINFWQFLLVTALGAIPSLLLTLIGTTLITTLYGRIGYAIVIVLLSITFVLMIYQGETKRLDNIAFKPIARKPTWYMSIIGYIYVLVFRLRYHATIHKTYEEKITGPAVVLCAHECFSDFANAAMAIQGRRFSTLAARYFFYNKHTRRIFAACGVYPKDLFNKDVMSIKYVMSVIKHKGIILIMPEGRLSTAGFSEVITPATAKLIQKLGVNTYSVVANGAYYACGKGIKRHQHQRIDIVTTKMFSADEIKSLTQTEISEKITQTLYYDDQKWQEENNIVYKKTPRVDTLSGIFYYCPECHTENAFMVKDNKLVCRSCGHTLSLDNTYHILHNGEEYRLNSIQNVYRDQVEYVKKLVQNEDFEIKAKVKIRMPHGKKGQIVVVGKGVASFNKDRFLYEGTIDGVVSKIEYSAASICAVPFAVNDSFEIYRDGEFFAFNPYERPSEAMKWVLYMEQNNKLRS